LFSAVQALQHFLPPWMPGQTVSETAAEKAKRLASLEAYLAKLPDDAKLRKILLQFGWTGTQFKPPLELQDQGRLSQAVQKAIPTARQDCKGTW
jgi:hypothetical protein